MLFLIAPNVERLLQPNMGRRGKQQKFQDEISIDVSHIRISNALAETRNSWDLITTVEDVEHTVMLSGPFHAVFISASCFAGFLEKDAYVRACRARLGQKTSGLEVFD